MTSTLARFRARNRRARDKAEDVLVYLAHRIPGLDSHAVAMEHLRDPYYRRHRTVDVVMGVVTLVLIIPMTLPIALVFAVPYLVVRLVAFALFGGESEPEPLE